MQDRGGKAAGCRGGMAGLEERSASPLILLDGALIDAALQQCTTACLHVLSFLACMAAQDVRRMGCLCRRLAAQTLPAGITRMCQSSDRCASFKHLCTLPLCQFCSTRNLQVL